MFSFIQPEQAFQNHITFIGNIFNRMCQMIMAEKMARKLQSNRALLKTVKNFQVNSHTAHFYEVARRNYDTIVWRQ